MAKAKGYRCHIITLFGLVFSSLDINNLEKTSYTLSYIEVLFYTVLFHNLTKEKTADYNKQVQENDINILAGHNSYLTEQ